MSERRTVVIEGGPEEILTDVVDLVAKTGASAFEIAYDRVGTPLAADEEPAPTDAVRWTATASYKRRGKIPAREIVGEHVVQPGENHARGGILAAVNLIERMGGNVVVLDNTSDAKDPRP